MKLTLSTCIFAAVAVALVHCDCSKQNATELNTCIAVARLKVVKAKTNDDKCREVKDGLNCVRKVCPDGKVPESIKEEFSTSVIFKVKNCDPFSSAGMKIAVPATILMAVSLILTIVLRG